MIKIDIQRLKEHIDCRYLIEKDLGQPAVSSRDYVQYRCPFHNEQKGHSFTVWANGWQCFGACSTSGDAVSWLQRYHNMTFQQACQALGAPDQIAAQPVARKPVSSEKAHPPSEDLQALMQVVVERARERLWSAEGRAALAYLTDKRGLEPDVIRSADLGFIPGEPGGFTSWEGIRVPHGIAIPWYAGRPPILWGIKVRRADGFTPKYLPVSTEAAAEARLGKPQQAKCLYLSHYVRERMPILICEGEFDCLISYQEACELVCPVTAGPAGYRINPRWYGVLVSAPVILGCYDADAAGEKAKPRLGELTARAQFVKPPTGKDITEFYLSNRGSNPNCIRDWLKSVL